MTTEQLESALRSTWCYLGPKVRNESDFKMELFHQLAAIKVDGVPLCDQVPGTPSCRLHAETKIENGSNSDKADLSNCDPNIRMEFNYHVKDAIELKKKFTKGDIKKEYDKLDAYIASDRHYYFLSAQPSAFSDNDIKNRLEKTGKSCTVRQPTTADFGGSFKKNQQASSPTPHELDNAITASIVEVLELYGKHRAQFHGFFWCNYEQEQKKLQTYPCEGDFVCQLYHRLRLRLQNVIISSEVSPKKGSRLRTDLVIYSDQGAIPKSVPNSGNSLRAVRCKR